MRIFEVKFEDGESVIVFADDFDSAVEKAEQIKPDNVAVICNEVVIK